MVYGYWSSGGSVLTTITKRPGASSVILSPVGNYVDLAQTTTEDP